MRSRFLLLTSAAGVSLAMGSVLILSQADREPEPLVFPYDSGPSTLTEPSQANRKIGYDLLLERCADCHAVSRVTNAPYIGDEWYHVVFRMMLKPKSQLSTEEAERIAETLAWISVDRLRVPWAYPEYTTHLLARYFRAFPERRLPISQKIYDAAEASPRIPAPLADTLRLENYLIHVLEQSDSDPPSLPAELVALLEEEFDIASDWFTMMDIADSSASAAAGRQLYGWYCASCHGSQGEGSEFGVLLNDPFLLQLFFSSSRPFQDGSFYSDVIARGREGSLHGAFGLSRFGNLTDRQIEAIVRFMRNDWLARHLDAGEPLQFQESERFGDAPTLTTGEQLFNQSCASCHVDGEGPENVVVPDILARDFIGYDGLPRRGENEAWPDIRAINDTFSPIGISNTMLREIIRRGRGDCPPFGEGFAESGAQVLSNQDMDSIIMYMRNVDYQRQIDRQTAGQP